MRTCKISYLNSAKVRSLEGGVYGGIIWNFFFFFFPKYPDFVRLIFKTVLFYATLGELH